MARRGGGTRDERRRALRALLKRRRVRTQSEISEYLGHRGFDITQSSLSRDLVSIGARKLNGAYRLVDEDAAGGDGSPHYPSLEQLRPFVVELKAAGPNILVVTTRPGLAQTVALALDSMGMPEVIGTVAGDDTVFVATPNRRGQRALEKRFGSVLRKSAEG